MSLLAPRHGQIEGTLKGETVGDKVRDLDRVMDISRRIAKERSESGYSLDSEGDGNTEIVDDGNSLEYI